MAGDTSKDADIIASQLNSGAVPTLHRYCRKRLPQAVTDENMLVITERRKETLNLGGEKVSPRLIEEVLMDHHSRPPSIGSNGAWTCRTQRLSTPRFC